MTTWAMTRVEPRAPVLPIEVKGRLSKGLQLSPFLVWDISVTGIGILLSEELQEGEIVTLTFGTPNLTLSCRVQWCALQEPEPDAHETSFRVGLKANQPDGRTFQGLVDYINSIR